MKRRIITAIILAILLIPVVIVPELVKVFEFLVILLSIFASLEVLNMYDKERVLPKKMKAVSVICTLILYFAMVDNFLVCKDTLICKFLDIFDFKLDIYLALGGIFLIFMFCMVFIHDLNASDVGKCLLEVIYVGVTFASFTVLRSYGVRFIVYLLIISCTTDIFALVFGLKFGKHKMAPYISPKKSWEGAIGGTAVATALGFIFLYFYRYFAPLFHNGSSINFFDGVFGYSEFTKPGMIIFMILLSASMSVCSQIGDLVASKLKRYYGIKDYSNLFPGHGGILDRFDSALFSSSILLVFIVYGYILSPMLSGV